MEGLMKQQVQSKRSRDEQRDISVEQANIDDHSIRRSGRAGDYSELPKGRRPKHLDLFKIRLPLPGIVSILHRVSSAVLFLFFVPLGLAALQGSLASPEGFAYWGEVFGIPLMKLVLIGFAWAWMHHFCAGIRYLLLDLHMGVSLEAARTSSKIVIGASLVLTLLIAIKLW
jgi:succinate dehydrogenase / fumarate reductase cytochrome b subunit